MLSDLRGELPDKDSESLTIDIHYPYWILDTQRIAIEQSIEAYFSRWLELVLNAENPAAYIDDSDYESFGVRLNKYTRHCRSPNWPRSWIRRFIQVLFSVKSAQADTKLKSVLCS